jgi:2'-5' RNA ligase
MRLFVAINPPAPVRARVWSDTGALRDALGGAVAWTRWESLHLTVRFLGEHPEERVVPLRLELERAMEREPAGIHLRLVGAGAFPAPGRARVLWVGVEANPAVNRLYQSVERACAVAGFGSETRPAVPHVTVGRVRRTARLDGAAASAALAAVRLACEFELRTVDLMQSELTSAGARHTVLAAIPLGERG